MLPVVSQAESIRLEAQIFGLELEQLCFFVFVGGGVGRGERSRLVTGEVELSRARTRVHRSSCRGDRHWQRPFIDDKPWSSQ